MYCTYVLYSKKFDRLYVGQTADLISRFHSHNSLATKGFTRRYRPWLVLHVEFFDDRSAALQREKELKAGQGRAWIRGQLLPLFLVQTNHEPHPANKAPIKHKGATGNHSAS